MVRNSKGAILIIVLATVIIVFIFSGVILSIISSQSRLTHHQVSRIKAYYATRGMMNYALEKLRTGDWVANPKGGADKYFYYRDCIDPVCKSDKDKKRIDIDIEDPDIPYKIQITIHPPDDDRYPNDPKGVSRLEIKTEY